MIYIYPIFRISPGPNNSIMKYENYCRTIWLTIILAVIVIVCSAQVASNHFGNHFVAVSDEYYTNQLRTTIKVIPISASDEELEKLPKEAFSYACMIDAGSSGSRVHVYRYGVLGDGRGEIYVLPAHVSFKERPGLSSFAGDPESASTSMVNLIDFMKKNIPESH